jgi:hypothetical protein
MACEFRVTLPVYLVSVANKREHWAVRHRRNSAQRLALRALLMAEGRKHDLPPRPWLVTMTRIGKRELDSDNLESAFKALRDEIAEFLGVKDDPSSPARFRCQQQRARAYSVTVQIESLPSVPK